MSNQETWGDNLLEGNKSSVFASKMAIGESVIGTVKSLTPSKFEGRFVVNMTGEHGEAFTLFPAGQLNYAIDDGLIEVGQTYRITRLESYTNKRGQEVSAFSVQTKKDAVNGAATTVATKGKAKSAAATPKF